MVNCSCILQAKRHDLIAIYAYVSDEEITKIVIDKNKSVQQKTEDLKDLALLKGGFDNITIVLVKR